MTWLCFNTISEYNVLTLGEHIIIMSCDIPGTADITIDISHLRDDVVLQDVIVHMTVTCIYSMQQEIFFCIRQSAAISYIHQSNVYIPTF